MIYYNWLFYLGHYFQDLSSLQYLSETHFFKFSNSFQMKIYAYFHLFHCQWIEIWFELILTSNNNSICIIIFLLICVMSD